MRYEIVSQLTALEYEERLQQGWRRFGFSLFRPDCGSCQECKSIRVLVATFEPDRSQKRAWAANASDVRLEIGAPAVSRAKLDLYDRYHQYQSETKGWSEHGAKDPDDYIESFVDNPFANEEWCYYLGDRLVGVGYVDRVRDGLSAIYFFHEPEERRRSLGTFNVLSIIENARHSGLPYVYLGYYVKCCRSLEYKGRFRPSEVLSADDQWRPFRGDDHSTGSSQRG